MKLYNKIPATIFVFVNFYSENRFFFIFPISQNKNKKKKKIKLWFSSFFIFDIKRIWWSTINHMCCDYLKIQQHLSFFVSVILLNMSKFLKMLLCIYTYTITFGLTTKIIIWSVIGERNLLISFLIFFFVIIVCDSKL